MGRGKKGGLEMNGRSREIPTLLGIPFDGKSSYLRGAAEAPAKIREALSWDAWTRWTETGVDLGVKGIYGDAGDLVFAGASDKDAFAAIESGASRLIGQ